LNAHGGNEAITAFVVDRINQETPGVAVELGEALGPFGENYKPSKEDEAALKAYSVTLPSERVAHSVAGFGLSSDCG
jgi:hypothetical protein